MYQEKADTGNCANTRFNMKNAVLSNKDHASRRLLQKLVFCAPTAPILSDVDSKWNCDIMTFTFLLRISTFSEHTQQHCIIHKGKNCEIDLEYNCSCDVLIIVDYSPESAIKRYWKLIYVCCAWPYTQTCKIKLRSRLSPVHLRLL
jgi:hypothetical protein